MFNKREKVIALTILFLLYLHNAQQGFEYYFDFLFGQKEQEYALKNSFQPPDISKDVDNKSKKQKITLIHIEAKTIDVQFEAIPQCRRGTNSQSQCIHHFANDESHYMLMKQAYLTKDYNPVIVLIESPVNLFTSWYQDLYSDTHSQSLFHIRFRRELSNCYGTIDILTTNGLRSKVTRVRPKPRSCQMRARYCIIGDYRLCKAMKSYDIFIKELLQDPGKRIFALRMHHFRTDLKTLSDIFGPIHITRNQPSSSNETANLLSQEGLRNVCYYFCEEIQLYKKLIYRAENLSELDRKDSLQQLNETCPLEYIRDYCPSIDLSPPSQIQLTYNRSNKVLHHSVTQRNIAFIHIGKTGGTTASKMIRRQCTFDSNSGCAKHIAVNEYKSIPQYETQISLQIQDYYHTRKPNVTKYNSFIVSVRNPVDRLVSWFIHQHPENHLLKGIKEDAVKLFECYKQIDDLATIGLHPHLSKNREKRLCQELVRNYTIGSLRQSQHARCNYGFYTSELLQSYNKSEKEIFLLRTNNFWEDWQSINTMLGGGDITRIKHITHRQQKEHKMAVTNRTISPKGLENFCRTLCHEIQLYKELIDRAINLKRIDKEISLTELKQTCPFEAKMSKCP